MTRADVSIAIALVAIAVTGGVVTAAGGSPMASDSDAAGATAGIDRVQASSTLITAAQAEEVDLRASVGLEQYEGAYQPDSTVNISVSAVDPSGDVPKPVTGVNMTVAVIGPDGAEDTFDVTSADQSQTVQFSLDDRPTGEYTVRLTSESEAHSGGYTSFLAGEYTRVYPNFGSQVQVGRDVQAAVTITSGGVAQSGVSETLEIDFPNGTTVERDITTDSDGFATLSLPVTETGSYRVSSATGAGDGTRFEAVDSFGRVWANGQEYAQTSPGGEVYLTGYVGADGSTSADETVTIRVYNTTDYPEQPVDNITATTDARGQFVTTWQAPDRSGLDFEARLIGDDGEPLGGAEASVVIPGAGDSTDSSTVSLQPEFDGDTYSPVVAPGDSTTATITARRDGDTLSDQPIEYALMYGYSGSLLKSGTVTTNGSGHATVDVSVPESAPDGAELNLRVHTDVDGETAQTSARASVQQYRVNEEWDSPATAGQTTRYEVTFTDAETGDPVPNVPVTVAAEGTLQFHSSVYDTVATESGSDGTATLTVHVPENASGEGNFGPTFPYFDGGFPVVNVAGYNLSMQTPAYGEVVAGETTTLEYTAETDSDVSGFLVVESNAGTADDPVVAAERLNPGEEIAVTLPETTADVGYSVYLQTIDENAVTSSLREYVYVQGTDSAPEPEPEPEPDAPTVSVDADDRIGTGEQTTITLSGENTGELTLDGDVGGWVVNETDPGTLLTSPNPQQTPLVSEGNDTWGHVFGTIGNNSFEVTVTAPEEAGTYSFTATSATENASAEQTFTIEVTNRTEHESGVSQQVFDAAAGDDGTLSRADVVATVRGYIAGGAVDGVSLSRTEVITLVTYYISQ